MGESLRGEARQSKEEYAEPQGTVDPPEDRERRDEAEVTAISATCRGASEFRCNRRAQNSPVRRPDPAAASASGPPLMAAKNVTAIDITMA